MKILVVGSGGREHALAWKIAQSEIVDEVFCAPGNPGMDEIGPCFEVDPTDLHKMQELVLQVSPDLIVIGPEAPLAVGLSDALRARGFDVFGPSEKAAQLESSKGFSKDMMQKFDIPTAAYGRFTELTEALDFLETMSPPYVIKADGLAAGKGVVICDTLEEAENEVEAMMTGKFGDASSEIVIEEFMDGEEASIFVLTDGEGAIYLPPAQDHKRVGDGDTGLNTGGMGSYAPAQVGTPRMMELVQTLIGDPLLSGMAEDDMAYEGVLYVGIIVTSSGPKVVEFNARFGDPECQALMTRLESDLAAIMMACAKGQLEGVEGVFSENTALTVVMAAEGYPGTPEKGGSIDLGEAESGGAKVFHAGTKRADNGALIANGGRVLNVTAKGANVTQAKAAAYEAVEKVDFPSGFHRSDIGWKEVAREAGG